MPREQGYQHDIASPTMTVWQRKHIVGDIRLTQKPPWRKKSHVTRKTGLSKEMGGPSRFDRYNILAGGGKVIHEEWGQGPMWPSSCSTVLWRMSVTVLWRQVVVLHDSPQDSGTFS